MCGFQVRTDAQNDPVLAATIDASSSLRFRLYLTRMPQEGQERVLLLSWDSQNEKNGLWDPFFYEHVAQDDIEARILIAKPRAEEGGPQRCPWGFMFDDVAPAAQERSAILDFVDANEEGFDAFLKGCFERALRSPRVAFRAVFGPGGAG